MEKSSTGKWRAARSISGKFTERRIDELNLGKKCYITICGLSLKEKCFFFLFPEIAREKTRDQKSTLSLVKTKTAEREAVPWCSSLWKIRIIWKIIQGALFWCGFSVCLFSLTWLMLCGTQFSNISWCQKTTFYLRMKVQLFYSRTSGKQKGNSKY